MLERGQLAIFAVTPSESVSVLNSQTVLLPVYHRVPKDQSQLLNASRKGKCDATGVVKRNRGF